jgi:hypothetical protein
MQGPGYGQIDQHDSQRRHLVSNLERLMRAATHHRSDDRAATMQRIEAKRDERTLGYGKRVPGAA